MSWWKYVENHSQVCPGCCDHSKGWWKLSEGHGASDDRYAACSTGCGTIITKSEYEAASPDTETGQQ